MISTFSFTSRDCRVLDFGEICDDGNAPSCGPCNATCGGDGTNAGCAIGAGCTSNAVCAIETCRQGVCRP